MTIASGPETIHKPRILCLHGGISAKIFRLQARRLISTLAPHFRLVFADGPYASEMHADLKPVYGQIGKGTCRRWSRWLPHHQTSDHETAITDIEHSLRMAMKMDPGTGGWVALMGLSQGAKLAIIILLENQFREQEGPHLEGSAGVFWKFGVILAGRALPYALSQKMLGNLYFDPPGEHPFLNVDTVHFPDQLQTPTLHAHGLRDQGLEMHQQLLHCFMSREGALLIEWDEGHRVPIKTCDVNAVTNGILTVAKVCIVYSLSDEKSIADRYRLRMCCKRKNSFFIRDH